ncbi:MAG: cadherin repeat domain-containing protein [Reichenbachiella sp.]|uniref:cadherin repeat domain-containing protein n=1 Tax=Reichenbachiella sp. TaxID=2184521 RepID=UPI003298B4D0
MKNKLILMLMVLGMASCSEDAVKELEEELAELTVEDFVGSINDGPKAGDVIGTIKASTTLGELIFSLKSESVSGAFSLADDTGEISVGDATIFDYETNPSLSGVVTVVNGDIEKEVGVTVTVAGVVTSDLSVTIDENPTVGYVLGTLTGTTNGSAITYSITAAEPSGALAVDATSGELTVLNESFFDYETRTELTATIKVAADEVYAESQVTISLTDIAPSWTTIGSKSFSAGKAHNQSIAVNNGIPYVAYRDEANGNKTTVMKYENNQWTVVGSAGISDGYATFQSLAFDNGIPYVAFRDDTNNRKTTVMKFVSGSWQLVGAAGSVGSSRTSAVVYAAEYQSLAFNNGVPYVAYKDGAVGSKVSVMKFNGTTWLAVGAAGFSTGSADYITLKFDNDIPYVAYVDGGNSSKVTVMKYESNSWQEVGSAGVSTGASSHVHLLFDGGIPYVAYSDHDLSEKVTVMKYDNSSWSVVGSAGFSQSSAQYQSLAVMGDKLHVAYRDSQQGGKATVMQFNGNSWSALGTAGFSDGNVNHLDMVVDNDIPYVVFRDDADNVNKTTVMRFDDK